MRERPVDNSFPGAVMSDFNTETRRAVAAIARMLTAAVDADPGVLANEIVQALRGHGWRPTAVQQPPSWRQTAVAPADLHTMHALAAKARQAITTRETP